jgi:ribosomal protein S18 acetylase RimI-like enzyme
VLLREVDDLEHRLVVAEVDEMILGYGRAGVFEPEPDAAADTAPRGYYLTGVFVSHDQRRGGIGAALTQARLDWIGERADEAWFFANARNVASIELHLRFGFEEVTRRFSFPGLTFDGGEASSSAYDYALLVLQRFEHIEARRAPGRSPRECRPRSPRLRRRRSKATAPRNDALA